MSRARLARRLRGGWDPSLHPRWPKGAPTSQGGEFARVTDPLGQVPWHKPSVEVMDPPAEVWPVPHIGDMDQPPLGEVIYFRGETKPYWREPLDVQATAQEAEALFSQITGSGPWTQDDIRENLTEVRHNIARWMRAVERVVGDVLGMEHSAWRGDVKLDVAGLGLADGVKTWECEFLFLSSLIHGHRVEKKRPWGLMVHEMMHAYSQQAGFDNGVPIGGQKLHFQDGHRMIEEGIADGAAYWNFGEILHQLGIVGDDYERVHSYSAATRDFEAFADAVGIKPREFFNGLITMSITERKAEMRDMIAEATRKPRDRWGAHPGWLRPSKMQLHLEDAKALHKWVEDEGWETSFASWRRLFAGSMEWQVDNKVLDEAKNYPTMKWRKMGAFWFADGGWWIEKDEWGEYRVRLPRGERFDALPYPSQKTLALAKAAARIIAGGGEVPESNILRARESSSSDDLITRMWAAATPAEIAIVEQDARLWLQTHEPTDEFYAAARLMARTKLAFDPSLIEFDIHQPRWPKGRPLGGQWRASIYGDYDFDPEPDDIADLQWGAFDTPNPTEMWKVIADRERDVNERTEEYRHADLDGRLKHANAVDIGARLAQDPRIDNAYEDWRQRIDYLFANPPAPPGDVGPHEQREQQRGELMRRLEQTGLIGETRSDGPRSELLPFFAHEEVERYRYASKEEYAEMVVHAVHAQWAKTSNDHDAMAWAVQLAAQREFEDLMSDSPFWMSANSRSTAEEILDDNPVLRGGARRTGTRPVRGVPEAVCDP